MTAPHQVATRPDVIRIETHHRTALRDNPQFLVFAGFAVLLFAVALGIFISQVVLAVRAGVSG